MQQTTSRNYVLTFLVLLFFISSCKYKLNEAPSWESEYTAPLLKSRVSLEDAITDTTLIVENPDQSLTLVIQDTVIDFILAEFLTVPDTSVESAITLDSIRLPTDSIVQQLTVEDLIGFAPPLCFDYPPGIPEIDTSLDDIDVDASTFFKWANLNNGEMHIQITNNSPTDIDSIEFRVENAGIIFSPPGAIVDLAIDHVPAFSSYTEIIGVDDMLTTEIESSLKVILNRLKLVGTVGPTEICPDHSVEIKIKLVDLGASEAEAVFPEQDIVDFVSDVVYDFGDEIALTQLKVKSGQLRVRAKSTLLDELEFFYRLPSGRLDGDPIEVYTLLSPPVPPETVAINETDVSLAGYSIDMTGNGDKWNRFSQEVKGSLIYSGECRQMTLDDTIFVSYGLESIIPSYVEGNFGEQTFAFTEGFQFDFFNGITGGTLDLSYPKMKLTFENSIGMDGDLLIKSAIAINSRTGASVALTSDQLSGGVSIPGPELPNVGQSLKYEIELNKSNSNIREFISLMPDSVYFDVEIVGNKDGSSALLNNFATDKSAITVVMDIEVPLEGITDKISLETDADLDLTALGLPEEITEGTLKLIAENWFPMDAELQIYFKDNTGLVLDSLIHEGENGTVLAGMINGDGVVEAPTRSVVSSFFDAYKLEKLQAGATQATVKFSISTKPLNNHVKLYSNYGIDFKLVTDFKYSFN